MARTTIPYGLWPSPIAPKDVAAGARRFGMVQGDGPWIYWTESRPAEKGRQTILRAKPGVRGATPTPEELISAPWSARSRVHEYGGGELLAAGDVVYFVNDADQDVYAFEPGGKPVRLTREPALRFADFALDRARRRLVCIGERHEPESHIPDNLIVAIALDGPKRGGVTELVTGRDFYASPRLSPDGKQLAFIAWDLPGMPWDEAALCVATLDAQGTAGKPRRIAGGRDACSHPAFTADGTLVFVTDEAGFGKISAWKNAKLHAFRGDLSAEYGRPMWTFGSSPYAITDTGAVITCSVAGTTDMGVHADLAVIDLGTARVSHAPSPQLDALTAYAGGFAAIASDPKRGSGIVALKGGKGPAIVVRPSSDTPFGANAISMPAHMSFTREDGVAVHAIHYAPRSSTATGPRGAKPPALVLAHGGPTSSAGRSLSPRIQFYTSRGFAVLDVDYAGSTGYGRQYRERLDGQWGIEDVADCAAAARHLAATGLADPDRIAIAGGSAGGYTVLMALATGSDFAAGSSHYGISDLTLLMEHTHKFESGYLHRLLGTTPKSWKAVCKARSPIRHVEATTTPVILFQGLEDKVVPPEQSRRIHESLRSRGIMTELHEFPGEGHGFRRAETIVAVLEAELAFLVKAMRIGEAPHPARHLLTKRAT